MTFLITGGSKCGKSSLAERLLDGFPGKKIYLATMQPFGEDAHAAITRHRNMRAGKGFETVEQYTDLDTLCLPAHCAVLLECMGNLCANEMFREAVPADPTHKILSGIRHLALQTDRLVIVTNQVGSDGITYPDGVAQYIRILGDINRRLALEADTVVECVCGIPLLLKGNLPCSIPCSPHS